jgi:hypothetical protein
MKKLIFGSFFLFASVLLFFSCQKEDKKTINVKPNFTSNVYAKDGILHFDTYETLSKVYQYLVANPKEISTFSKQFNNFVSLKDAFQRIDWAKFTSPKDLDMYSNIAYLRKEGDELFMEKVLELPIYDVLFNDNALIVVGQDAIKAEKEGMIYRFDVKYLGNLTSTKTAASIPHVSSLVSKANTTFRSGGTCSTTYDGGGRKMATVNFPNIPELTPGPGGTNTLPPLSGNTGLRTTNYKRFLGIWWTNSADKVSIKPGSLPKYELLNTSEAVYVTPGTNITSIHSVTDVGFTVSCTN